jgi:hypothetical protein
LGTPKEILIVGVAVGQSVSGVPFIRVSTDNGSTYRATNGDYINVDSAGSTTNATGSTGLIDTAATAARYFEALITLCDQAVLYKPIQSLVRYSQGHAAFVQSTSQINAVRVVPSGGGTFSAGTILCFIR